MPQCPYPTEILQPFGCPCSEPRALSSQIKARSEAVSPIKLGRALTASRTAVGTWVVGGNLEGSYDVGSCCVACRAPVTASKIWMEGEGSCEMLHALTALGWISVVAKRCGGLCRDNSLVCLVGKSVLWKFYELLVAL